MESNYFTDKRERMSKLYDYLLDKYGLGVHDESDMDIIRDIVLEETGFKWIPVSERLPEIGAEIMNTEKSDLENENSALNKPVVGRNFIVNQSTCLFNENLLEMHGWESVKHENHIYDWYEYEKSNVEYINYTTAFANTLLWAVAV